MAQLKVRSLYLSFSVLASTHVVPVAVQALICRLAANALPIFECEFLLIFSGEARREIYSALLFLSRTDFSLGWIFGQLMAKKRHESYLHLNYYLHLVDDARFNRSVKAQLPAAWASFRR
jgi:hypothetical protein